MPAVELDQWSFFAKNCNIDVWKGSKYNLGPERRRFSRPSLESCFTYYTTIIENVPRNYPIGENIGMKVSHGSWYPDIRIC